MPATRSAPVRDGGQRVGDDREPARVGEHRREVLELDARLRKVGDLAGQRRDHAPRRRDIRRRSLIAQRPSVHVPSRSPSRRIAAHGVHLLRRQQSSLLTVQRQGRHVAPEDGCALPQQPGQLLRVGGHRQRADDAVDLLVGVARTGCCRCRCAGRRRPSPTIPSNRCPPRRRCSPAGRRSGCRATPAGRPRRDAASCTVMPAGCARLARSRRRWRRVARSGL